MPTMSAAVHVRPMAAMDHSEVIRVGATVFQPFGDYRTVLRRWLDTEGVFGFAAERQTLFCGALLLAITIHERGGLSGEILAVEVAPDQQRTGVGTALIEATVQFFETTHRPPRLRSLRLSTAEDNEAALALFRAFGFGDTGEDAGEYAGGQRIVRMERDIPYPVV